MGKDNFKMDQRILKNSWCKCRALPRTYRLCSAHKSAAKSNGANIFGLLLAGGWSNEKTFAKF